MIIIDRTSDFYPINIFGQLKDLSKWRQMDRLHEVPLDVLLELLQALKTKASFYKKFEVPRHINERIEMVIDVIHDEYGDALTPEQEWKAFWILPY